jgi:hypothetical protein
MVAKSSSPVKNKVAKIVKGVLDDLGEMSEPPKPKSTTKDVKWEMELDARGLQLAERWVNAKTVHTPVAARLENASDEFKDYALRILAKKLFDAKNKPSNPLIVLRKNGKEDCQFQHLMTDKFTLPKVPEGVSAREHFINMFMELGISQSNSEKLVDDELQFNPVIGTEDLNKLCNGHYTAHREWVEASETEKIAGAKLAAMIRWNGDLNNPPEAFTPEERSIVVKRDVGVVVRAGFYGRVAMYVENVDQLIGIFSVIKPVHYPSHAKFGMNDTSKEIYSRKIEISKEILKD